MPHWTASVMEGVVLVLTGIELTLDIDLFPLHTVLLPKLQSKDLQNALNTITVFHTILLLVKERTSNESKPSVAMGPYSWNSLCFHHPEAAGLTAWQNGLLKMVTAPGRWQPAKLGQGSPGCCICSESVSAIWCYLSASPDSWVKEPRDGNGSGTTHYDPQ